MDYNCPICKKEFYPYPNHRDCANQYSKKQFLETLDQMWELYNNCVGELKTAWEYN